MANLRITDDGSEALRQSQIVKEKINELADRTKAVVAEIQGMPSGMSEALEKFVPRLEAVAKLTEEAADEINTADDSLKEFVRQWQEIQALGNCDLD